MALGYWRQYALCQRYEARFTCLKCYHHEHYGYCWNRRWYSLRWNVQTSQKSPGRAFSALAHGIAFYGDAFRYIQSFFMNEDIKEHLNRLKKYVKGLSSPDPGIDLEERKVPRFWSVFKRWHAAGNVTVAESPSLPVHWLHNCSAILFVCDSLPPSLYYVSTPSCILKN